MAKDMKGVAAIEWTDRTWNPVVGCSYHHSGCLNCYAVPMSLRQEGMNAGAKFKGTRPQYMGLVDKKATLPSGVVARHHFNGTVNRAGDHIVKMPLRVGKPTTWFVNSMSDVFHENMQDDWLTEIWEIMVACPQHNFQVLTKRPNRARRAIERLGLEMASNIWLGASICENKFAKVMVRDLVACGAAVTFVSAEPLLAALPDLDVASLDWLIAGGESGTSGLRPTEEDWVRDLRDRCAEAGTPFFFKQWGHRMVKVGGKTIRLSKEDAGHLIKGTVIFTDDATEALVQRLSAAKGEDTVFDNPNIDVGMADDKMDRVFRAIKDEATSVAELVRATNLSHPTVARIARELARQGKVFEFKPDRDPKLGSAQPSFAFSRRTDAERMMAKAELMMAQAKAMMADAG